MHKKREQTGKNATWKKSCQEGFTQLVTFGGRMSRPAFLKYLFTILGGLTLTLLLCIFLLSPTREMMPLLENIWRILLVLLLAAAICRRYRDAGQPSTLLLVLVATIIFKDYLQDLDPITGRVIRFLLPGVQTYCIMFLFMPSKSNDKAPKESTEIINK